MATAAATAIYNFVNAAALSAGANAALAYKAGHLAVSVASVAATTALSAAVNSAIADANAPENQGGFSTLTVNPNEPRRLQIGKRINGGVLVDWYTRGSTNQHIYLIVYLGEGPMGNCTGVYGGGRRIHEGLTHGVRTVMSEYRDPDGDRLWVTYYDGRVGQTANSYLVSQGVGWTNNHIGEGCAYAIIEGRWDPDNMATPPTNIAFELEGAKLYDRRLDTTAGGSGSHRLNSPATWAVSDNPAVALDHYLLGRQWNGRKIFGIGLDPEDVPYDRFVADANLSDEDVAKKAGGTQKRYRANGFLVADRSYSNTIKDLCRAMNARPADFGGRIGILDGESRTSVMTLTDDDVIEGSQEHFAPKRSWTDLINEVSGTYQNPDANYQAVEYPKVTDASWVTQDGGSTKALTADFEMETDPERAQRLAWLRAMRERRQAQLTGTYKLRAVELEQGDWFVRSGDRFGAGKTFEVISRVLDPRNFTVTITAFEVDPADSAWASNLASDPPPAPISNADTLGKMEVPTLSSVIAADISGANTTVQALKINWNAPADPRVSQIVIEAANSSGEPITRTADVDIGKINIVGGVLDSQTYFVRARFIGSVAPSEWSTVFEVPTGGTYAVGQASSVNWSDVLDDGGRPDDNADVTGDNVASAVDQQGTGATANSLGELNSTDFGNLAALLRDTPLSSDENLYTSNATLLDAPATSFTFSQNAAFGGIYISGSGNSTFGYRKNLPVISGRIWRFRVRFRNTGAAASARLGLYSWDGSGVVQDDNVQASGVSYESGDGTPELEIKVGAPDVSPSLVDLNVSAGASSWRPFFRCNVSGAEIWQVHAMAIIEGGYELGADPTDQNIAAGYQGQDWGGTASEAEASNAQQQWSDVGGPNRPEDNSTLGALWGDNISGQPSDSEILNLLQQWAQVSGAGRPDDNADVTILNTALALLNQGDQATASVTVGNTASRPSSPTASSWHVNQETNELQFYTGSVWIVVSNLTDDPGLTGGSANKAQVTATGAPGTLTTDSVTVTPSGGSGHTYSWALFGPDASLITITDDDAATTTFSASVGSGDVLNATAVCTISAGDKSVQVICGVYILEGSL